MGGSTVQVDKNLGKDGFVYNMDRKYNVSLTLPCFLQ